MAERTLLILAGYTAVGKTTIAVDALRSKRPLFGKEYDELLQRFRMPSRFPEMALGIDEKLAGGTWLSYEDIELLEGIRDLPDAFFIHVDLISARLPRGTDISFAEELIDGRANDEAFRAALSAPFFSSFGEVVVNTLYAPWATIAGRWTRREGTRPHPKGRHHLFSFEHPGVEIHRSIYESWFRCLDVLRPRLSLLTEVGDDRIVVRRR
jgi:hypothetical protein